LRAAALLGVAALAVHLLLPQVAEAGRTWQAMADVRWRWVAVAAVFSAGTYFAAAAELRFAAGRPLSFSRTIAAQLAASFANPLTPASLGGIGLNVLYLTRAGLLRAQAVTAVAVNNLAGAGVHVVGLVIVASASGQLGLLHPPHPQHPRRDALLIGSVIFLVVAGLVLFTSPAQRHRALTPMSLALRQAGGLTRNPRRGLGLVVCATGVTAGYIAALAASLVAYDQHVALLAVALSYLAGSSLAALSPTPGGLAAIEAALVAALTQFGVAVGPAVAAVLTFRLVTFWLPALPGIVAYRGLRSRGAL
jgi:glycosyltransferase 2 family protein